MHNMYFTSTFKVCDVWSTYLGTNAYMGWVYIAIWKKNFSWSIDPCPDKWLVDNQTSFVFGLTKQVELKRFDIEMSNLKDDLQFKYIWISCNPFTTLWQCKWKL